MQSGCPGDRHASSFVLERLTMMRSGSPDNPDASSSVQTATRGHHSHSSAVVRGRLSRATVDGQPTGTEISSTSSSAFSSGARSIVVRSGISLMNSAATRLTTATTAAIAKMWPVASP